jgi:hypothetical protein
MKKNERKKIKRKRPALKVKRRTIGKEIERDVSRETFVEQRIKYERMVPYVEKEEETYELPLSYGDNKIVVMVRDPYWIYAYWEITPQRVEEIKSKVKESMWEKGEYILRVYDITGIDFKGDNANRYFDILLTGKANNWYINVGVPDRTYCVDIGIRFPDGRFFMLARSNYVTTPRDTVSSIVDEEWMATEEEYQQMFRLSGELKRGLASEEVSKLLHRKMEQQIFSGGISSMFSPMARVKEKGFWLTVDAELIIYGATLPDAIVTVQNKQIKLNPDGTFSLRFALPDGKQVIPVRAVSQDKSEVREITPIVTRETIK